MATFRLRDQKTRRVAEEILGQVHLLEGLGVHEIEVLAVVVQIFHLVLLERGLFDLVFGAEAVLDHGAGAELAHLYLDEAAQVARCAVLHLENGIQLAVPLDHHAGTHLCCCNHI